MCVKCFKELGLEIYAIHCGMYFRHHSAVCICACVCSCRLASIHADAPEFVEMSVEQEILVTGIKVVDLLAPYAKGGKIGKKPCVCDHQV